MLTASSLVKLDLLDGGDLVKEGTLAQEVQSLLDVVGDSDLDLRVANTLELDAERSVTLVDIDGGGGGNGGQSGNGKLELHVGWVFEKRLKTFEDVSDRLELKVGDARKSC